jgi:hypothetical protein
MAAILLNKLQPGKTYTVAVKAINSDGDMSPNSITYTFTTPTTNLDGTSLVGYNSAVNVSVGASGAMTAGTMDLNGLQKAGQLDLDDVWNTTNLSNGGGYASVTGNIGGIMVLNKNGLLGYQITSDSTHIDVPITASFNTIPSTINGTTARSSASISIGSVLTIGQAVNSIKIYNVSNKITASASLLYNDYTKTASGSNVGAKMFVNFYSSAGAFLGNVVGASIVVPNNQDTVNYLSISASATASAYPTTSTAHITIDFYPIAGSAIGASTSFFFTNPITTNSGEIIGSSSGIAKFLLNNKTGDAYFGGTIFTTSKIGTLPIVDWTASQINNSPLVGSAYNVAASALLSADSASTNALNYLGVKNTSISGSVLISSANTITNASNQLTTISSNGITITTASGASAASASGARIVLNSVGFASYNASGSPTVTITAADGTARFTGSVFATAGLIGGFNLTASNQNGDAQMYIGTASQQNWAGMIPGTQWSFFSGATDNLGTSALFRVSNAGLLYAQNAVITGSITAQYGVIGNWNIGSQSLWAGDVSVQNFAGMIPGTLNVFFGGATSSAADNATFRVTNTGSVLATAGYIGGWSLGQTSLSANNTDLNLLTLYNTSFYTNDLFWTGSGYNTNYAVSTNMDTDGEYGYLQWSRSVSGPATASFFDAIFSISTSNLSRPTNTILGMSSGSVYNFSAYVKGGTATSVKPLIRYYTASSTGTLIATTSGGTYSIGTSSFTRVDISFTASSNGTYYEFVLQDPSTASWTGPPGAGFTNFYFDKIMLNRGSTPLNFVENQSITLNNASGTDPINITNGSTISFLVDKANQTYINSASFGRLFSGGKSISSSNLTPRTILNSDNLIWIARSGGTPLVLQRPESPTGTSNLISFLWGATNIGTISYNSSTGNITYGGTSDQRLKKDIVPLSNSIDRLKQLKPVSFNWINHTAPIKTDGFIAHELQDIVPSAVTGIKNEVDENEKPIYQSVDNSKVVPLLVSALQETLTKIEELEQRLASLENK